MVNYLKSKAFWTQIGMLSLILIAVCFIAYYQYQNTRQDNIKHCIDETIFEAWNDLENIPLVKNQVFPYGKNVSYEDVKRQVLSHKSYFVFGYNQYIKEKLIPCNFSN